MRQERRGINMHATDTIAATATPIGRGGIGVIRVSGPAVTEIIARLGKPLEPRVATFRRLRDTEGNILDEVLLLYFQAPNSFTGEDVLEIHGHGGPVILDMVLQHLLSLGARLARPGEFSERAFLNDKLDLAQAEAIADLIDAGSRDAARAAVRTLEGDFSKAVHALAEKCLRLRMYVEAAIDFPEEEIDFLADTRLQETLAELRAEIDELRRRASRGRILRDGINVVLVGEPNVGKSSLMNAIAGTESAIVTDIPGTTRDILREFVQLDGIPLHLIDTAGLRDCPDVVEAEGIRRARKAIENADLILHVSDIRSASFASFENDFPAGKPRINVLNKADLVDENSCVQTKTDGSKTIVLSAVTRDGIDLLLDVVRDIAGATPGEGDFSARQRHLDALNSFANHLADAQRALVDEQAGELAAECLRLAHAELGNITGQVTADDLLGEIFSSFCIGK